MNRLADLCLSRSELPQKIRAQLMCLGFMMNRVRVAISDEFNEYRDHRISIQFNIDSFFRITGQTLR